MSSGHVPIPYTGAMRILSSSSAKDESEMSLLVQHKGLNCTEQAAAALFYWVRVVQTQIN